MFNIAMNRKAENVSKMDCLNSKFKLSTESARLNMLAGGNLRDACDLCHAKKVRCDRDQETCRRCRRLGEICIFSPRSKNAIKRPSTQTTVPTETGNWKHTKTHGRTDSGQPMNGFGDFLTDQNHSFWEPHLDSLGMNLEEWCKNIPSSMMLDTLGTVSDTPSTLDDSVSTQVSHAVLLNSATGESTAASPIHPCQSASPAATSPSNISHGNINGISVEEVNYDVGNGGINLFSDDFSEESSPDSEIFEMIRALSNINFRATRHAYNICRSAQRARGSSQALDGTPSTFQLTNDLLKILTAFLTRSGIHHHTDESQVPQNSANHFEHDLEGSLLLILSTIICLANLYFGIFTALLEHLEAKTSAPEDDSLEPNKQAFFFPGLCTPQFDLPQDVQENLQLHFLITYSIHLYKLLLHQIDRIASLESKKQYPEPCQGNTNSSTDTVVFVALEAFKLRLVRISSKRDMLIEKYTAVGGGCSLVR